MVFVPGSTNPPEGPLDLAELEARIRSEALANGAMVCLVGGEKWVPLEQLVKKKVQAFEVKVGDNVVGPVTLDQIQRGVDAGKIPRDGLVRQVGEEPWQSVGGVLAGTHGASLATDIGTTTLGTPPTAVAPRQALWARLDRNVVIAIGVVGTGLIVAGVVIGVRGPSKQVTPGSGSALAPSASMPEPPPTSVGLMPRNQFITAWNAKAAAWEPRLAIKDPAARHLSFASDLSLDIAVDGGDHVVSVTMTKGTSMQATILGRQGFSLLVGVVVPEVDERGLIDELGMKTGTSTTAVRGLVTFSFSEEAGGPEIISARPTGAASAPVARGSVSNRGVCANLTTILTELTGLAADTAAVQPAFKSRNLTAASPIDILRNVGRTKRDVGQILERARAAKRRFEGIEAMSGEAGVRKDIITAYNAIITALDAYQTQLGIANGEDRAQGGAREGLQGFLGVAQKANKLPSLIADAGKKLTRRCKVEPTAPSAPAIHCQRSPDADDICEGMAQVGYNCWGGTVGDVKKVYPSCAYIADSRFCCDRERE